VADAGVVHQHVAAATLSKDALNERLAASLVGDVRGYGVGDTARFFNPLRVLDNPVFIEVGDIDDCAGLRERFRDSRANSGGSARHDGDLVLERKGDLALWRGR
jgi:hypothetical protein